MEVLLTGNTGYVTEAFLSHAFPDCHVVIVGESGLRSDLRKNRSVFSGTYDEKAEQEIYETYDFDWIVIFSDYLSFHGTRKGEMEHLRRIMQMVKRGKDVRMVYLSGPEGGYSAVTGKTLLAKAAEMFCMEYANTNSMQVKVIRSPYLYSGEYPQDYIYQMIRSLRDRKEVTFSEKAEQEACFLCMEDLGDLLFRVFNDWEPGNDLWAIPNVFRLTFERLARKLVQLVPDGKVTCTGEAVLQQTAPDDRVLRRRYGWFPKISVTEDLESFYAAAMDEQGKQERSRRLRSLMQGGTAIRKTLELAAGFLLMELLLRLIGGSAQFRMVDFRLAFIVLMATANGFYSGIAAAFLASISLGIAYSREEVSWMTLFYEPSNWLPFIVYFVVGAVCGYIQMKNREDIAFIRQEDDLIRDKYYFIRELYEGALQGKKQYKKQIMESRDSFGKIFDITRQLDVVQPQELFMKTIYVMEQTLENRTISIYSIGKNKFFARLEASSGGLLATAANSLRLETLQAAMPALQAGEVWSNTDLLEGYPMYLAGIRSEGELVLLISIQEAEYAQMSLYYQNLIKILCGLVEVSLLRALEYQQALRSERYIGSTGILRETYFLEQLDIAHAMREGHMAKFTMLALDYEGKTLEEAGAILQSKIRENDILGASDDGGLFLILTQTGPDYAPLVIERIQQAGLSCRVVTQGTDGDL